MNILPNRIDVVPHWILDDDEDIAHISSEACEWILRYEFPEGHYSTRLVMSYELLSDEDIDLASFIIGISERSRGKVVAERA